MACLCSHAGVRHLVRQKCPTLRPLICEREELLRCLSYAPTGGSLGGGTDKDTVWVAFFRQEPHMFFHRVKVLRYYSLAPLAGLGVDKWTELPFFVQQTCGTWSGGSGNNVLLSRLQQMNGRIRQRHSFAFFLVSQRALASVSGRNGLPLFTRRLLLGQAAVVGTVFYLACYR